MIVMCRELFVNPKTGPCGAIRDSNIYPIGYTEDFDEFKKIALEIIDRFDLLEHEGGNDIYGFEFYEGSGENESRADGKSIWYIEHDVSFWNFYDHGKHKIIDTKEGFVSRWRN